ncbi:MAG: hypothetical protein J3R72DRAFT_508885 [Linnemannia gamsii]|nr:MAG: hypothetical protein J3R72DRAFT_508885 [Linnemannia gamsii]
MRIEQEACAYKRVVWDSVGAPPFVPYPSKYDPVLLEQWSKLSNNNNNNNPLSDRSAPEWKTKECKEIAISNDNAIDTACAVINGNTFRYMSLVDITFSKTIEAFQHAHDLRDSSCGESSSLPSPHIHTTPEGLESDEVDLTTLMTKIKLELDAKMDDLLHEDNNIAPGEMMMFAVVKAVAIEKKDRWANNCGRWKGLEVRETMKEKKPQETADMKSSIYELVAFSIMVAAVLPIALLWIGLLSSLINSKQHHLNF